jgi:hypothetical protein
LPLFRRRESLHERLAREGGLDQPAETHVDPPAAEQEVAVHGLQRPRDWDVTVTVDAPDVAGDAVRFVTLPDGSVLVEDGPDTDLDPLASAVEQVVRPPYRARAARQSESLWAVQARRIEVIEIPDGPMGDEIELTRTGDGTTYSVDDAQQFGSVPVLEERGAREGAEFTIHAERLEGDLWEIRATAL